MKDKDRRKIEEVAANIFITLVTFNGVIFKEEKSSMIRRTIQ